MGKFHISILSEESVSNTDPVPEKGGVWLQVKYKHQRDLSYLPPKELMAWIEGGPLRKHAYFKKLSKHQNERILKLFELKLHKLFK